MFGHDECCKRTNELLKLIHEELQLILKALQPVVAQSLTVVFTNSKGQLPMPATLQVGATATAVAQEWSGPNGTGSKLAPAGVIAFTSSDPTIATVDPASGLVTAVGPGTATITGTDPVNNLSGSDTVSDTPLVAQSMTVVVTAN